MPQFLVTWLVMAVSFLITAYLVPGFYVTGFIAALIAAVMLGLVNAIVRPLLILLTLPLTIFTLGFFLLIVNALTLQLAAFLTRGFSIRGLFSAILGSIVLTIVSSILNMFFKKDGDRDRD
ncbi:MAG: phage holin family protein [Leptolyngbyaceae cyanobacterium bins.59]|nr:phage holin family protein [Leptolyngbyaceae cyanobacterium bins.59]